MSEARFVLYVQNRRQIVKKTTEKEHYTTRLPEVRIKPSQRKQLDEMAAKAGMAKKVGEFIRRRLFGGKIEDKPEGMAYQDVVASLPELAKLRAELVDRPELLPIIDRISLRHRNALLHDSKIQHPR